MKPERWERVVKIFEAVVDLEPGRRPGELARLCGDDRSLRSEVEDLLDQDSGAEDLVRDALGLGASHDANLNAANAWVGRLVGPFRIQRVLGVGGMGAVYLAHREGVDFRQRVAVKLVRDAAVRPEIARRLHDERRILASLEHPGIARFVDGGTTDDGIPYLAMEYVDGKSLEDWARQKEPGLRTRLQLFIQVCEVVTAAHRALVVHRDLKPSNILVTGEGVPKLLDFGIAKLLDAPGDGTVTRAGFRALTPAFASPEQVRGEPVTTATDVYAMGQILYRLLSDRPGQAESVSSPAEMVREICERTPPPPSEVAADEMRARLLHGDLDTIVLKAIHKDPAQRYGSVEALADDLQRHLDGRPVRARPDTLVYRTTKFVRRNWMAVASVAALIGILGVGAIRERGLRTSAEQAARRADREATTSHQVSDFLIHLFEMADPKVTRSDEVSLKQALELGTQEVHEDRITDPSIRARLLETLGVVHTHLAEYEKADQLLGEALELLRQAPGDYSALIAETLEWRGLAVLESGRPDEAEAIHREALAIRRRLAPPGGDLAVAASLNGLATVLAHQARWDEARVLMQEALAIHRRLDGPPADRATMLTDLAWTFAGEGRYAEAEPFEREALEIRERILAPDDLDLAESLNNLADTVHGLGRYGDAEGLYRRALAIYQEVVGLEHPFAATVFQNLGDLRMDQGRPAEAEELYRPTLRIKRDTLPAGHPRIAITLHALAEAVAAQGRTREAVILLREALEIREAALGADHPDTVATRKALAGLAVE